MTNIFLTLMILVFSGLVSAQELPAESGNGTSGNGTEVQEVNTSLSIDDIGTSNDYPVCHRMKNGVVKHQIQAATTQTVIFE